VSSRTVRTTASRLSALAENPTISASPHSISCGDGHRVARHLECCNGLLGSTPAPVHSSYHPCPRRFGGHVLLGFNGVSIKAGSRAAIRAIERRRIDGHEVFDRSSSGGATPQGLTPEDVARVGVAPPQVPPSPKERGPSGLRLILGDKVANLPEPAISLSELLSGGPPPDGIPSIDKPVFERADAVHFVADTEPVLALTIDGEARAYPVQIAIWHEIINDTVGGVPVAVTYCPLCNSAIAYDRRVAGRVVTFGTTGMLWNSAMVMYDRQTETVWSHFNGQAIAGALTGTTLRAIPMSTVSFKTWRDANPTGLVLNRTTGHNRDYGRNPYRGYDQADNTPFLFKGRIDSRFKPMTRMIGITSGEPDGPSAAIPLAAMQVKQVRHFVLGETPVVAFWVPGTNSSLDTEAIESGTDVGATGVFRAAIEGRNLTFEAAGDRFIDVQTQSTWNLLGRAIAGPMVGKQLEPVQHVDTFWFAWSTFRPRSTIVDG
jgi:hypothetical protein